jgi:hypothetical protein
MGFSRNYFVEEKLVDQVDRSLDRAGPVYHGPAAIAARGSSPELGLRPRAREEEGSTGLPIPGSPGLRMRRSGGVTMVSARSTRPHLWRGERGRRGRGGVVGGADVGVLFYRVEGGVGRPGIGEEWAAAVVHHNGDEGSCFGRGSGEE